MEMHRTLKTQKFNFRLAFPYLKKKRYRYLSGKNLNPDDAIGFK